jgi:hypothetical protein
MHACLACAHAKACAVDPALPMPVPSGTGERVHFSRPFRPGRGVLCAAPAAEKLFLVMRYCGRRPCLERRWSTLMRVFAGHEDAPATRRKKILCGLMMLPWWRFVHLVRAPDRCKRLSFFFLIRTQNFRQQINATGTNLCR